MKFTADFETTTDTEDCRVWAYCLCNIDNWKEKIYGNCIEDFLGWCELNPDNILYFHNLKFDGEFILSYLLKNGWTHTTERKFYRKKEFSTLISDKGMFYSIKLCFGKERYITIYDSLKIIPFSVEQVADTFGLPISKLEIDYKEKREKGYILTQLEKDYISNDVEIMARALKVLFDEGLNQITQGSNALHDYKKMTGAKRFKKLFPPPAYDYDVRQAYRGGFTYVNPAFQNKEVGKGIVLDVNSLYPWVMHDCPLPYGEGIFFNGKYEQDNLYNLYVQMFTCEFELKEGYIPTLQIKNSLAFVPTQYLASSNGEEVTLCLTSVDLKLFFEHYHVYNITYHSGWKFKSTVGLFTEYIDKWIKVKIESTLNGNKGMRQLAKLMLNALYGKFALNPNVQSKIPYLEDGIVKYRLGEKEMRTALYIPIGVFVTANARYKTISSAQKVFYRFAYADTDSLHLIGTEIPEGLEVDPVKLGAWKLESEFSRAKFIRQKTYIEDIKGELNITCAGMPKGCYAGVTWENFTAGSSFAGKLQPAHVAGGIVLKDIDFTIKK
jgi:hypothetical protein